MEVPVADLNACQYSERWHVAGLLRSKHGNVSVGYRRAEVELLDVRKAVNGHALRRTHLREVAVEVAQRRRVALRSRRDHNQLVRLALARVQVAERALHNAGHVLEVRADTADDANGAGSPSAASSKRVPERPEYRRTLPSSSSDQRDGISNSTRWREAGQKR